MNVFIVSLMLAATLSLAAGCAPLQRFSNETYYYFDFSGTHAPKNSVNGRITVNSVNGECWILSSSIITRDMPRAFTIAADDADRRGCSSTWVILGSHGGEAWPAMQIGTMVRSRGYNTSVMKVGGHCSSACGLIFISGVRREVPDSLINSRIGFHQPAVTGPDGKKICQQIDSKASAMLLLFAKSKLPADAAEKFHKKAIETECSDMTYIGPEELFESGIATGIGGPSTF